MMIGERAAGPVLGRLRYAQGQFRPSPDREAGAMQYGIAVRTVPARWLRGRCRLVSVSSGGGPASVRARCLDARESPA